MNQNTSFVRKIIYISMIVALLPPLFLLGQPASQQSDESVSRGGVLANLRAEHDLSQASLGEIDPASESMKLASLGLSGVATNILWTKANEYKKTQQWDKLSATLNQISKLQPNFIKVWEAQSHNLSYNVSVEFDNYEHRYTWVKRGMYFLMDGIDKNRHEPRLTHYMGWFVSQKIGRADEHVQFRRLFRRDKDFHRDLSVYVQMDDSEVLGPDNLPDNWLVGRKWYLRAYDQVENKGEPIRGKSPLVFYASGPMTRINYVTTIEEEGYLDEQATEAWETAEAEWRRFGMRQISTSWGHNIQLEKYEDIHAERKKLEEEFYALVPGLSEQIREERIASLPEKTRVAMQTPAEARTEEQYMLAYNGNLQASPSYRDVAARMPADVRARGKGMARRLEELAELEDHTDRYRNIVNYPFWRTLCEVEKQDIAIQAHKHLYDAKKAQREADLFKARDEYNRAWDLWAEIFGRYPLLLTDTSSRDLVNDIERGYVYVLGQLDEPFPEDFKLMPLLEMHGSELAKLKRVGGKPKSEESTSGDTTAPDAQSTPTSPDKTDSAPSDRSASEAAPPASDEPTKSEGKESTSEQSVDSASADVSAESNPADESKSNAGKDDAPVEPAATESPEQPSAANDDN